MPIQRGDIYFVNLNPVQGREQAGQRPVLVLSIDAINRLPLVVTVVVGTKGENITRDYPTNVRFSPAVVLLEHDEEATDQDALEKSLITHNHLDLLNRVKRRTSVSLGSPHNEFLGLLGTFYKSLRYDRFTLASVYDPKKEKDAPCRFLSKHLQVDLDESSPILGTLMTQDTEALSVGYLLDYPVRSTRWLRNALPG
jgi:mRNA-degrading endonuclease toxin of MazEF toxin-antitoxin module